MCSILGRTFSDASKGLLDRFGCGSDLDPSSDEMRSCGFDGDFWAFVSRLLSAGACEATT